MPGRGVGWRRDPRTWAVLATGVTGVSGYLVLAVVARALRPAEYADFLAIWSVLFGLFTVIGGVGLHAAASVSSRPSASGGLRVLRLAVRLSLPAATLGAGLGVALSRWFDLPPWLLPTAIGVAVGGYLVQTTMIGSMAALSRWRGYGMVVSAEGITRLASVLVVAALVGSLTGFVVAVAVATLSWVLLLLLHGGRRVWRDAAAPQSAGSFLAKAAQTSAGSLGPAILIVGYPALVKAMTSSGVFAAAAGILLAVVLTRAPFLVPLAVIQPAVVSRARSSTEFLARAVGAVLAAGIVGAAAGAVGGPTLLALLSEEYRVDGWLVGLLLFDASVLASMMLLAAARLAQGRRRQYVIAWATAVVVAVAFLMIGWPLDLRIGLGLLASPFAGTVVLLVSRRPITDEPAGPSTVPVVLQ